MIEVCKCSGGSLAACACKICAGYRGRRRKGKLLQGADSKKRTGFPSATRLYRASPHQIMRPDHISFKVYTNKLALPDHSLASIGREAAEGHLCRGRSQTRHGQCHVSWAQEGGHLRPPGQSVRWDRPGACRLAAAMCCHRGHLLGGVFELQPRLYQRSRTDLRMALSAFALGEGILQLVQYGRIPQSGWLRCRRGLR